MTTDRPTPTYGFHAAFIGWMVCTYNDALGIWEDDRDGVIHEEPFTAAKSAPQVEL